jgi:hypothetical protein
MLEKWDVVLVDDPKALSIGPSALGPITSHLCVFASLREIFLRLLVRVHSRFSIRSLLSIVRRQPNDGESIRGSFSGLSAALAFNTQHKANASATAAVAVQEPELISDSWEGALARKMAVRGKLTSRRPRSGHWILFFISEESWLCFLLFFSGC